MKQRIYLADALALICWWKGPVTAVLGAGKVSQWWGHKEEKKTNLLGTLVLTLWRFWS